MVNKYVVVPGFMNLLHVFAEKDKHSEIGELLDRYIDCQKSPLSMATPLCMVKIMTHLIENNHVA